ncbi:ATP-binding protein [Pendulispora brunnea]|uniref:histidine kinase n=1 Tax=Pendulispora brunnea TaxID=2905690 RepID=A0ABZ2KHH0_9BACT
MHLSFALVCAASAVYLVVLLALVIAARRVASLRRLANSPYSYAISLGVYASTWTYYGSVGFSAERGLVFLAVYLGPVVACLLVPLLWEPVRRIQTAYQLGSLADFFAFRFRSQSVGVVATLVLVVASVPYLGQQVLAVTDSLAVATGRDPSRSYALAFCAAMTLFTALFGAHQGPKEERQEGLILAIGIESMVKLVCLLVVGAFAVYHAFGDMAGLGAYLRENPHLEEALREPLRSGGSFTTLLLASTAAAFLMPRQYEIAFGRGTTARDLRVAGFVFPLFLLVLTLPTVPILFAGRVLDVGTDPDYYALGIPLSRGAPFVSLLTFLGGVSAASAMIMVTVLALSRMVVTHLVLPLKLGILGENAYDRVRWLQRTVMALLIFSGYLFFTARGRDGLLVLAGISSFVAMAQFVPGLLGALFWPRANGRAFLVGLALGFLMWLVTSVGPLLLPLDLRGSWPSLGVLFGVLEHDTWSLPLFAATLVNTGAFVMGSLLYGPRPRELEGAAQCAMDPDAPRAERVVVTSVHAFSERLAPVLGEKVAELEVRRALSEVGAVDATRVRGRVERNLSSLVGPVLARMIVNTHLRTEPLLDATLAGALKAAKNEADRVRFYLMSVLEELPLGVCALGPEGGIILWNRALEQIVGTPAMSVIGSPVEVLDPAWAAVFTIPPEALSAASREHRIHAGSRVHVVRVHRTPLPSAVFHGDRKEGDGEGGGGAVFLVEDYTEQVVLTAQVAHQDRLASIGRLAAGVAHEIGNPTTAIACLAENIAQLPADRPDERAAAILEQTRRIDAIVRNLLGFTRTGAGADGVPSAAPRVAVGLLPVAPLVDEAITLTRMGRGRSGLRFENLCDVSLEVLADRQQLVQVMVNLLTNASDASPEGGLVVVDAQPQGESVVLCVADTGTGIHPDIVDRIAEPFFTTKDGAAGAGLGLSVVFAIVREHGGDVTLETEYGVGTRVLVRWPSAHTRGSATR